MPFSRKRRGLAFLPVSILALASACSADVDSGANRVEVITSNLSGARPGDGAPRTYPLTLRTRTGQVFETGMGLSILGIVDSPVRDGIVLQATDVTWIGNYVYASYNVRGDTFLGAIQVIDATDPANPKVVTEAIYKDTDLARIRVSGTRIFAAGADANEGGTLESFTFDNGTLHYDGFSKVGSYSSTFVDLHGYEARVAYGDKNGGVATYDLRSGTPVLTSTQPLEDARWVAYDDARGPVAVAGSPSRLLHLGSDPVGIAGADVGAPTWGEIDDDKLYLSSDGAGLLVYDLKTMKRIGQLATTGNANGVGVANDARLAFLANGEEGLVVADVLDPSKPVKLASIDMLDDDGSANAVALSGKYIALADGLGGVKLLQYERDQAPVGDCDGDGIPDDQDPDDDDDGVLDVDDAAICNPEVVCKTDQIDVPARFVGDFFNLPCDHKDVEGPITGVDPGHKPTDYDWYDPKYYVFSQTRDSLLIEYSENYFPVDTGLCGDPFYFAAHWYTTAIATEAGTYRFEMGSDDDSWLYIDGKLQLDLGGIHAIARQGVDVQLSAGPHRFDIWFAERHKVQSGLEFEATAFPSDTARIRFEQHTCLDPNADTDGDGVINSKDIAPLLRP